MKKLVFPALILVIGGAWFGFRAISSNGADNTVPVRKGTIVATVTSTGKVAPVKEARLTFNTPGRLGTLSVSVGDQVQSGQLVATLDTSSLELSVQEAQATLDMNKLKLDQARSGARNEEIAIAQANLASAQAKLDDLKSKPTQDDLKIAKAAMDKAAVSVQNAQAEYDKISWANDVQTSPQAKQLQLATLDFESAKAQYEQVQKGPTDQEIKVAESDVAAAKAQLAIKTNGASPEDIAILQKQVDLSNIALGQAKNHLSDSQITAPFAGTVLSIPVNVGEIMSPQQTVVSIGDISSLKVNANIDEVDVGKIATGQDVSITFDAFPGRTLNGKITKIDPGATIQQGATVYQTTVEFASGDMAVRSGMLANLSIAAQKKDGALLVPNRAVQTVGKKKIVEVVGNGNSTKREVETGLTSDTETELLSGVEEGETVIVR